jgi:hypothetical protein
MSLLPNRVSSSRSSPHRVTLFPRMSSSRSSPHRVTMFPRMSSSRSSPHRVTLFPRMSSSRSSLHRVTLFPRMSSSRSLPHRVTLFPRMSSSCSDTNVCQKDAASKATADEVAKVLVTLFRTLPVHRSKGRRLIFQTEGVPHTRKVYQ